MRDTRYENGFTLVELLVALMVTSIILTAVATLAFALGTANQSSDDTSRKQAQVRYATLRISEVIKYSKLVYSASESEIVLWQADDDPGDGMVNDTEKVYVKAVPAGDGYTQLQLCKGGGSPIVLIPQCSNVQFQFDEPLLPPTRRKFVSISFDLVENGIARQYQMSASLRGWAGNLLDDSGEIVSGDDD